MPADVVYRRYRIVSDIRELPGIRLWKAKAAVVKPADALGIERVHPIITNYFFTEQAAIDCTLTEAKRWSDKDIASGGSS